MTKLIDKTLIDQIEFQPSNVENSLRPLQIQGSEKLLVIISSLQFFNWNELNYIASGVWDREGIGINGTGFRYPTDELDPNEEILEGVEIYNPLGEIQLSIDSFESLMLRYFQAIILEGTKINHSILQQSWWNDFIDLTQKIEARLSLNK